MANSTNKEFLFIRLDDRFAFIKPGERNNCSHQSLALDTGIFDEKIREEKKPIVDDAGKIVVHRDHIELTPAWPGSVRIRSIIGFNFYQEDFEHVFDEVERQLRFETAELLVKMKGKPVIMIYTPVIHGEAEEICCIEPQSFCFTLRRILSRVKVCPSVPLSSSSPTGTKSISLEKLSTGLRRRG